MKKAARFVQQLKLSDINPNTIKNAKRCVLDFLGAALGGADTIAGKIATKMSEKTSSVTSSTIWHTGKKTTSQIAAFINGTTGSALDIDDGHRMAVGHPGGAVIPAAFAIAEATQSSGSALLEAIICGYEIAIRWGNICRNETSQFAIIPGTGRWGSMGAAAAAAKLLSLDFCQIEQALAISNTYSPLAPVVDDLENNNGFMPMTKYVSGWGGLVGVWSAKLAEEGFTGITSTVNFSQSILPCFGESFEINNVYFKPFSACRWTHSALEGVLKIMKDNIEINKNNIQKIKVKTFANAYHLRMPRPRTIESAQYSLPFLIGLAIQYGAVSPQEVNQINLSNKDILAISDKVEIIHSNDMDSYFPHSVPSEVELLTTDGKIYLARIITPKGDPKNPLSDDDLKAKFRKLATMSISRDIAEKIIQIVEDLDKIGDTNKIFSNIFN